MDVNEMIRSLCKMEKRKGNGERLYRYWDSYSPVLHHFPGRLNLRRRFIECT